MKKILGIDVGITSVGWGIINENNEIINCGVRLFNEQQTSGNVDRRNFRGNRRVIRRRKQRIIDMKLLLINNNIINNDFVPLNNPYELRVRGLTNKLNNDELATILLQYAKRRGSSLEVVEEEVKNELGTKSLLLNNKQELKEQKYISKVQVSRIKNNGKIRGHENVFKTEDYLIELKEILSNQNLDKVLEEKIINIVERRRHFSEGPGSFKTPTPYGRFREITGELKIEIENYLRKDFKKDYLNNNFDFTFKDIKYTSLKNGIIVNKKPYDLIALMRGKCSIFPDEFRAPKRSLSAELFNFLNDLNNLSILNRDNPKVTKEEKEMIISIIREKGNITINQLYKLLNVDETYIKGFRANNNDKPIITEFVGYKKILKVCKDLNVEILNDDLIDSVIEILTETVVEEERFNKILKFVDNKELATSLSLLTGISEYHNLSLKAIKILNDEMIEESLNQQQIITRDNLGVKKEVKRLVFDESAILSPTAKRAHKESLKLINQLIKEYGNFHKIIIETTRDKNSQEERKRIRDTQKYFENSRKEAETVLGDYGSENINSSNILKLRLYKEQNGKCAYSGKDIDLSTLIRDSRAYEIDHIIPISVSFDNSYNNKVLVLPLENQKKGNKTPYYYFQSGNVDSNNPVNTWNRFEDYVHKNFNLSNAKKQNLLFMENINKYDTMKDFINRNLADTSYAIRTLMETLKLYFNQNDINTKVLTIKGKQTSLYRSIGSNIWYKSNRHSNETNPFRKDRDFFRHHAIDALIIAALSNNNAISRMYDLLIDGDHLISNKTGEVIEHIDPSNDTKINLFLKQLSKIKDEDIKFSWKIDTKPNRQVSDQTIYSTRLVNEEHVVIKKINNIYEMESKDIETYLYGSKKDKLLVSKHDIKTFEIIKKIYEQYKHEKYPFNVYKENNGFIRKYAKKNNGPVITSLKYEEDRLGNYIDITPKNAKDKKVVLLQISPYRADLYYDKKSNMYKFVTIRYSNINKKGNKFIIDEAWYKEQLAIKKINDNYEFLFSLNRNNLIRLVRNSKGEVLDEYLRFITVNNDIRNQIEVKPLNYYEKKQLTPPIGKSTIKLEKCNVSITGKKSKVIKEDLKLVF